MNWRNISLMILALVMFSTVVAGDVTTTSKNVTATLTLTNTPPVITQVSAMFPSYDPIAASTRDVQIWFVAYDDNGKDDLDDLTASVNITNSGGYTNSSCVFVDIDAYSKNYTCTFTLQYYDNHGTWDINASIRDNSGVLAYNDSESFTYNKLAAMNLTSTPIDFGELSLGATNVSNENNPLVVYNLGNLALNINITGADLVGTTNSDYVIGVGNVTVDNGVSNITLSTSNQTHNPSNIPIAKQGFGNLEFWIDIPSLGLIAQEYNATWTITGYE